MFLVNIGCLIVNSMAMTLHPYLALVHFDLFIGMCLPSQLLELFCCVLTSLQMRLDNILSNTI